MEQETPKAPRLRRFVPDPETYRARYGEMVITNRDLDILETVWRYRMLDGQHIRALIGGSNDRIGRRLQGHVHNERIGCGLAPDRFRYDLNRTGGEYSIYWLRTKGWRTLLEHGRVELDEEGEDPVWRQAHTRITTGHAKHQVMLSNFRCLLELACRSRPGLELAEWDQGFWGEAVLSDGSKQRVYPDALFTLRVNGVPRYCFLEVDRSTKEHRSKNPIRYTVERQYRGYWWYLQSDDWKGRENHRHTCVLYLTSGTDQRLANLQKTLREMERPPRPEWGGPGVFWFGLNEDLSLEEPESVLRPIWRTVTGSGEPRALV